MNEATLQRKIQARIRERGGYCHKNHGGQFSRGIPDLDGCYRRYSLVLEVKMPGKEKTVTENQAKHLKDAAAAGAIARVVSSVKQVDRILDAIDRKFDAANR